MGWRRLRTLVGGCAIVAICQIATVAAAAPGDGPATAAARLVRAKSRPTGAIAVTVSVYEPGQLSAVGLFGPGAPRAGASSVTTRRPLPKVFGSAIANLAGPAKITLKLRPSAAARRALRRRHHLRVYITVALLPSHGDSATITTRAMARLRVHARR